MGYTLWLCQNSELENGPVEIVSFPINSMVIFQFAMLNYQRVPVFLAMAMEYGPYGYGSIANKHSTEGDEHP